MKIKKILVVEDNSLMRELIVEIVKEEGIEVIEASSAKDGWWKFQDHRPDLVITDFQMETSDAGLVLAQKIKTVSLNTPVIMVTGKTEKVEKMENKVVNAFLSKPFDIETLREIVKFFLKERG